MKITILLFASLREALDTDRVEVELSEGATAGDALGALDLPMKREHLRVAVNHQFTDWAHRLTAGDEVSFIPPVAGG